MTSAADTCVGAMARLTAASNTLVGKSVTWKHEINKYSVHRKDCKQEFIKVLRLLNIKDDTRCTSVSENSDWFQILFTWHPE